MNQKVIKLLGALLFIILINVGLFTFSNITLTSFWISWAFIHVAFLIFVSVFIFGVPSQRKLMHAYSEAAIVTYYLIIELCAGFVLMFQFAFFPVIAFVIQAVILAVFVVAYITLKKVNQDIDRKEDVREENLVRFRQIMEAMKDVRNQVEYSASYRKIIEHTYDAIAGSQVNSNADVYETEQKILDMIAELKTKVALNDEMVIKSLCRDIENAVADRNRNLRIRKR